MHSKRYPREIKARADSALELEILEALQKTGLSILSEESGLIEGQRDPDYLFIVDPLDGTYNFVKDLGPCSISIALWRNARPAFGVIFSLPDASLLWGGRGLGAFCDGRPVCVSATASMAHGCICTGIPARLNVEEGSPLARLGSLFRSFAKVRMLGSASISLASVAMGRADAYSEQGIMLWDVAAGLALVEGAGGAIRWTVAGGAEHSLNVDASNGLLPLGEIS